MFIYLVGAISHGQVSNGTSQFTEQQSQDYARNTCVCIIADLYHEPPLWVPCGQLNVKIIRDKRSDNVGGNKYTVGI